MTTADHIDVFKDDVGEFRWTAVAKNGEPVATSGEGYKNRGHAVRMARRLFPDVQVRLRVLNVPTTQQQRKEQGMTEETEATAEETPSEVPHKGEGPDGEAAPETDAEDQASEVEEGEASEEDTPSEE